MINKILLKICYTMFFLIGLIIIPLICFIENLYNLWNESFFFEESKERYIKSFKRIKSILKL